MAFTVPIFTKFVFTQVCYVVIFCVDFISESIKKYDKYRQTFIYAPK
jgi:hypothetical protein